MESLGFLKAQSQCLGESWMVNPSRECVIEVEEGASLAEGDGISVSRMVASFVLKDPNLDVNNIDARLEACSSYLGKPICMIRIQLQKCKESWPNSFARCLIEINSEAEFTESITIGIPELEGPDFIKETIRVEYEWKPPRCHTCNIFRHLGDSCPKKVNAAGNTIPRGVPVAKGFQVGKQFNYQPKAPKPNSDKGSTREATSSKVGSSSYSNESASHKVTLIDKQNNKDVLDTGAMKISNISSLNPFYSLGASTPASTVQWMFVLLPVPGAFVKHYNQFLRAEGVSNHLDAHNLFIRVLDYSKADCMVRDVTDDEIKSVMFSMGDDRAPGPDGIFFSNGKLLKELNHTIISLIPKVTTPARINDYMPISCCNVLYKCISKIIANRVKEGLGDIVSINSAFVPGHRIFDNILLTQELMRNYHRRRGPPRCAFKVDIQKAYDTVDWNFLETILVGFGFHPKMVQWIIVYVSGASYSISVNGPEIKDEFQYHHLCEQERIINLCFTDDLFLFARGHPSSVSVIMDALEEFKYLGVPLISSRLLFHDCKILVEKLESRVNDWRNKFLSLASLRLPLIWSREMKKGKAKVAWDSMCMPKHEGTFGYSEKLGFLILALNGLLILDIFIIRESLMITNCSLSVFSSQVWSKVRVLCGMDAISPHLSNVVAFIVPLSKGEGCTLFSLSKVFPSGFSLERFFKEAPLLGSLIAPIRVTAGSGMLR
ncbi:sodium/hydrogen exchanger 6 [Tanacetum coccineum]|uniref:Sodium/hydrogen exchanger 6 n=1 Tax=Tanacetum coccineum TaxID=301880 RepID=A0ABQ5CDT0_9ASTR